MNKYSIGYDIGSSSIKVALIDVDSREVVAVTKQPQIEMPITSPIAEYAEQDPEMWWKYLCEATKMILAQTNISSDDVVSCGISYQMHGLVIVDKDHNVLRPSIIWCDSRAVEIGRQAMEGMGDENCMSHLLNSPGNFTASKLKWVQLNEPAIYDRIYKCMLPGDFIHMKLTDEINTTITGLSEGIMWDFKEKKPADLVFDYYGFDTSMIPEALESMVFHGAISTKGAAETGLAKGTPITYKSGDQPNNALSLNVMQPGDLAVTAGTSGVVYGITTDPIADSKGRINSFAHVNYTLSKPMIGTLLCINGAGITYAWLKQLMVGNELSYPEIETMMSTVGIGADDLRILPYGNGAERMFGNKNLGATIRNIQFNLHSKAHMFRAGVEGVAFSFVHGCQMLESLGMDISRLRAGNDNLFQSKVFGDTIANLLGCRIEVYDTTGAIGAAKASLIGAGLVSQEAALSGNHMVHVYEGDNPSQSYADAYNLWKQDLDLLTL